MKILHCCLANFYIDDYGYQENILPKMHKLQGHKVTILASTETYLDNKTLGYAEPGSYINEFDIPVTRLPYISYLPKFLVRKLRLYIGTREFIEKIKPDIIFLHDCQFLSIAEVKKYCEENSHVKLYVDSHTDFVNSGKNWISKNILHGLIYRWCAKTIEPYVTKFYGTLPVRSKFLENVYGVAAKKIQLLEFGADHTVVDWSKKDELRKESRSKLGLENKFVLVSGGKIDERKNIHLLMQAVSELNNENLTLILFGTPTDSMSSVVKSLLQKKTIKYMGWATTADIYNYMLASDLAIFPGTHSILWEQAIGVGLPCIFKRWPGMEHLDLGANCLFLEDKPTVRSIKKSLTTIIEDPNLFREMKQSAVEKGIPQFSYYEIAKRAIEQ